MRSTLTLERATSSQLLNQLMRRIGKRLVKFYKSYEMEILYTLLAAESTYIFIKN